MNYDWDELDFTRDCDAAAAFNQLYFWGPRELFLDTVEALRDFVRTATPRSVASPNTCQILTWFTDKVKTEHKNVTDYMYRKSFDECTLTVCSEIPYPGDPDIVGVGMLAGYFTEAILATLYIAAYAASHDKFPRWLRRYSRLDRRIRDTALSTMEDFYVATLLFNTSIVIAGLKIIPKSTSTYTMLQSTLVSGLTLSVPLALWPLQPNQKGWFRFYSAWLAINIVLSFVEVALVVFTKRGYDYLTRRELHCLHEIFQDNKAPSNYLIVLQASLGIAVFVLVWPIVFSVITSTRKWKESWSRRWAPVRFVERFPWTIVISSYGLVNAWATLIVAVYVRQLVAVRFNPTSEENDNTWGFGQVMALSTWLPVLIALVQKLKYIPVSEVPFR